MIKMTKVTKKMVLEDILESNPKAADVLIKNGMHCAMCHMASGETLEEAAEAHGADLEKILNELNKTSSKKK